jgi:hypothetical protein
VGPAQRRHSSSSSDDPSREPARVDLWNPDDLWTNG